MLKKKYALLSTLFILGCFICACRKENGISEESAAENSRKITAKKETKSTEAEQRLQWEKGYSLPVDDSEREEAEKDCKEVMKIISEIYKHADKKEASNVILSDETLLEMQNTIKKSGYSITAAVLYSSLENYESTDLFLKKCAEGESGSEIIYELFHDGSIKRMKYIFDGTDMYVLSAGAVWNSVDNPEISYVSCTRIAEWKYTDKGWFCYKLCVPEPPEVTEIVDGSCLIRIKPRTEEQREMSKKCVQYIGYQGNNLLRSNWNTDCMEKLDYNGIYEYLYKMKYKKEVSSENDLNGIPKEEFENLIMEYLPVTSEQIQEYAVFDKEKQTYAWVRLTCSNYTPTFFGASLPEVTDIKENDDGTVTLTVDAVCDMVMCDDAVITHRLTVQFAEDGSFQYLGNEILNDGIQNIPNYQYRICAE